MTAATTMPKSRALTLGFSLLACAVSAQAQERPTLTCSEDVANARTPALTQPNPGEYRLTMVAIRGSRRGESRTGPLHLEKSRAVDGKRITFRNEFLPDTAEHLLIGHTSVDLLGVGAPMARSNDAVEPSWTSRDKTHPGVLVLVARRYGTDSISAVDLLIGTVSNHRDGSNWLDGAGIHLSVNEISDSTFAGHWGAWGIIHDGSGYFCARRVGPAALTEERPRRP